MGLDKGTSPRMRGKQAAGTPNNPTTRNIPAYAGKTIIGMNYSSLFPEHPRVCGENPARPLLLFMLSGTSPRMRGKRNLGCHSR